MIKRIESVRKKDRIGNKARSLSFLDKNGFRIPETIVLTNEARDSYTRDPDRMDVWLREELERLIDTHKSYAVRSSSEIEDDAEYSFAGQFKTFLNIGNMENLLDAIRDVWDSAQQVDEGEYLKNISQDKADYGMGVIIQEMVMPQWSGVAFSINPVTGRNEIIIEGIKGSGEDLVQKGENPCRWTYIQGAWGEFDEDCSPGISVLDELLDGIRKLRKKWGKEIDIEWAYDGKELYFLQCRTVTAQQYPVIYSNHISREVLPGIIKPLVWSVNIPVVNSAWIRLLEGLLGPLHIKPEQLSQSFYYRAYFNMGTLGALFQKMGLPKNSLESLMGRKDPSGKSAFRPSMKTMQYLPRILWFLVSNLYLGRVFKRKMIFLDREINALKKKLDEGFTINQYTDVFRRIKEMSEEAAYYNIVIPLAMQILNWQLKKKMEKRGFVYEDLDFSSDFPGLRNYDPKYQTQHCAELWRAIPDEYRKMIRRFEDLEKQTGQAEIQAFKKAFETLLKKFGHFSESGNDFSYPTWMEDPDFLFSMVRKEDGKISMHVDKTGKNSKKKPSRFPGKTYQRAGKYRLYRERISSEYTRGYGLFRDLFLHTGRHLTAAGKISASGDVFFLTLQEHDVLLQGDDIAGIQFIQQKVSQRKQEIRDLENVSMPSVIYGDEPPPLAKPDEKTMKGIPVSPGIFEGEIVVVRGYKDFEKKVEDAILVIPFSDVGWTPVLTRAGAIVSESGGMLSHASIVARELSIPAIASVDHACSMQDGIRARLDGYNGLLIIDE